MFSYTVDGKGYRSEFEYPPGAAPAPEVAQQIVTQFPAGARVPVFYDPAAPQTATLSPAAGRDSWLILGIGIASALFGLGLLMFHG